jgi:hypothetical protein
MNEAKTEFKYSNFDSDEVFESLKAAVALEASVKDRNLHRTKVENFSSSMKHSNHFIKPGEAGEMMRTREGIKGSSILSSLQAAELAA